jgi:hypothetical protein
MGDLDRHRLADGGGELPERVWLTLAGWSIELFPAGNPQDYVWQGTLRISGIHAVTTTGMVEVTLTNGGGEALKAHLSRREADAFAPSLAIGGTVRVGLLGDGIHWVPLETW